ncbi:calmodulin-binding protein [Streptosporangium sp. NPDC002721]|uniref:BP74-related protein n=1 Tax=Streptosporangium sp. NPDC002721 TaxID=3366188 RepID=UPI0036C921CE
MRRLFSRTGCLAVIAMLATMMAVPAQAAPATRACATPLTVRTDAPSPAAESEPVYFTMTTAGSPRPFVIKLTDPEKIRHARRILSGQETERTHVMGRIIKRPAPYNPAYGFHLDPNTIDFFQMAIEVCDATLSYVEEHLDEACGAFLPGCFFCPWTSRLVAEVPAP